MKAKMRYPLTEQIGDPELEADAPEHRPAH
jgi:hypothetical protein